MQTRRKDGADARVFELHGYERAQGDQTLLEIIWYLSFFASSYFYLETSSKTMASLNATAESLQPSSTRTKRHCEDEVCTFCISFRDANYTQITDSASKRPRTECFDLTSDEELEPPCFLNVRYTGSHQQADRESSVREMLRGILDTYRDKQADVRKLSKRNIELSRKLTAAEDEFEEKVMELESRHSDYMSAITCQALDVTTGICNLSGKLVHEDCKLYIMDKCGAVGTRCLNAVIDMLNTPAACV